MIFHHFFNHVKFSYLMSFIIWHLYARFVFSRFNSTFLFYFILIQKSFYGIKINCQCSKHTLSVYSKWLDSPISISSASHHMDLYPGRARTFMWWGFLTDMRCADGLTQTHVWGLLQLKISGNYLANITISVNVSIWCKK